MDPKQGQESRVDHDGHKSSSSDSSGDSSVQSIGIARDMSSDFDGQTNTSSQSASTSPLPPMPMSAQSYDQSRIPASIFGKPSTPMDWSAASNDSLFSLQLGNNSFSREQVLMMKSGELPRLNDEQPNSSFSESAVTAAGDDCKPDSQSAESIPDVEEPPVEPGEETSDSTDKAPAAEAYDLVSSAVETQTASGPLEAARPSNDSHGSNRSFAFQV